jgi:hypothetical protein
LCFLFVGAGLFWGEKPIFGVRAICGGKAACGRWRKSNMSKTKEKQRGTHVDKPSHVRVRVFYTNVMAMSQ